MLTTFDPTLSYEEMRELAKSDNKELIDFFIKKKVLINNPNCAKCGKNMNLQKRNREDCIDKHAWRCTIDKSELSIRNSSFLHRSKLSLGMLLKIIYCYLKYPLMQKIYLLDIIGISETTLIDWTSLIRDEISFYLWKNPLKLGKNNPVQIDESLFGKKRKYNRGKKKKGGYKTWVFGIIEEETNLNVMWVVKNRKKVLSCH